MSGESGTLMVLGAAGGTGRLVVAQAAAAGWHVRAGVRRPGSAGPLAESAMEVVADVTGSATDLADAMRGANAVICAVGAQGSAAMEVDGAGVAAAVRAAQAEGVGRFVLVSSMFADRPEQGPPFLAAVLTAKQVGERALMDSALEWTIVRPGGLTDAPATGLVNVVRSADNVAGMGMIARGDVAAVALGCLDAPATIGVGFDVVGGSTPIGPALAAL